MEGEHTSCSLSDDIEAIDEESPHFLPSKISKYFVRVTRLAHLQLKTWLFVMTRGFAEMKDNCVPCFHWKNMTSLHEAGADNESQWPTACSNYEMKKRSHLRASDIKTAFCFAIGLT